MCDIDPKDIRTCSAESSNLVGGSNPPSNPPSNGGNPGGNGGNGGNNGNNTNPSGPIEPELGGGMGGYSLDNPNKNK